MSVWEANATLVYEHANGVCQFSIGLASEHIGSHYMHRMQVIPGYVIGIVMETEDSL